MFKTTIAKAPNLVPSPNRRLKPPANCRIMPRRASVLGSSHGIGYSLMASIKAVFDQQARHNGRHGNPKAGDEIDDGPRCSAEKLDSIGDESKEFSCTLLCWAHINTS